MQVDGLRLAESPWGMNSLHGFILPFFLCTQMALTAGDDDYKPGPDSLPQPGVPKGEMVKDKYTAEEGSVFPGTEREYQIYLPAGLDASKPAPFMVFQDGVIYQAPVVFDNLIAKKEIPPLIGIFIKPGVVPAANENALPRFNRSYEYDSVTDTYSHFLIEEFLPAIKAKHKLNLSDDPNARGIAGSSSGGICAFMVAWHRPDQFRRVFTSVGTYVGIHGADQLAVLVRKHEPKPLRIHLQSGEGDNNLYCGDWWMANQMMERSLTWNGYDVSHTWGTGGHNQKHATTIFPDVLRGLWKGYPEEAVKANPRGDAKWRGYEVVGDGEWEKVKIPQEDDPISPPDGFQRLAAAKDGTIYAASERPIRVLILLPSGLGKVNYNLLPRSFRVFDIALDQNGHLTALREGSEGRRSLVTIRPSEKLSEPIHLGGTNTFVLRHDGVVIAARDDLNFSSRSPFDASDKGANAFIIQNGTPVRSTAGFPDVPDVKDLCLSPDQTLVYASTNSAPYIYSTQLVSNDMPKNDGDPFAANVEMIKGPAINAVQRFGILEQIPGVRLSVGGLCVDTNGWLYVATSLGIQVLDQAGRVNFIIPAPMRAYDVCFGGKDLSELFIACGDTIYKRPTKAKGYISGQMAPIKPPPPKL